MKYDLFGIINHYGIIQAGHYSAFIKNAQTNQWYQYNDSNCKEVTEVFVKSQNEYAYILFYKRRSLTLESSIREIYP